MPHLIQYLKILPPLFRQIWVPKYSPSQKMEAQFNQPADGNVSSDEPTSERTQTTSGSISFGPIYTVLPSAGQTHTHTAIVLHGRGSSGAEFAEEFLGAAGSALAPFVIDDDDDDQSSPPGTLPKRRLPGWRWVFPTSPSLWSTAFQESMPAWFEAHSLGDITARRELQVDGIRESVRHILEIVQSEIDALGGDSRRVFLGGISQGGAVGLWTLLCQPDPTRVLGGFFGASTWLPFASDVERLLASKRRSAAERGEELVVAETQELDGFVETMMAGMLSHCCGHPKPRHLTPVFLGHGVDDAYVDVELGMQAARILRQFGLGVDWKEYSGAEEEGHWFKEPEEIDNIFEFLASTQS
ncbi:hypothetical protein SLS62_003509 [Diatrype stigma]|uniref:Phospholipase/carboxylesterase/thioesterase domain-containing protein n=1 Tax=Diatrype stigma TaxID=117547 RepID=A0AAN9YU78_9PEZI